MPRWIVFDTNSRLIVGNGSGTLEPNADTVVPPFGFMMQTEYIDTEAYRMRADLNGIEPKPPLGAVVDPLTISAGETVTVDVTVEVNCYIDGELSGTFGGIGILQFDDPGVYTLDLKPTAQLVLPESFTVTVT